MSILSNPIVIYEHIHGFNCLPSQREYGSWLAQVR